MHGLSLTTSNWRQYLPTMSTIIHGIRRNSWLRSTIAWICSWMNDIVLDASSWSQQLVANALVPAASIVHDWLELKQSSTESSTVTKKLHYIPYYSGMSLLITHKKPQKLTNCHFTNAHVVSILPLKAFSIFMFWPSITLTRQSSHKGSI